MDASIDLKWSCLHSRLICSTLFVWCFDKIRMNVTSRSQIKKKSPGEVNFIDPDLVLQLCSQFFTKGFLYGFAFEPRI